MPVYDRACAVCGWQYLDSYEPSTPPDITCPDGHPTQRVWLPNGRSPAVIGDEFPGGKTFENLGHTPVTVYSRSELKREMDARGIRPMVRHQGEQGSDKSKHTTRWV